MFYFILLPFCFEHLEKNCNPFLEVNSSVHVHVYKHCILYFVYSYLHKLLEKTLLTYIK